MPGRTSTSRDSSDYDDRKPDHQSRDDRKSDYHQSHDNNVCFTCGKAGHWARDCTESDDSYGSRRRGGYGGGRGYGGRGRGGRGGFSSRTRGSDVCYKCGNRGHFARECENEYDGGDRRPVGRNDYCYRCGQAGHMARHCSSIQNTCYNCHKEGHLARDCPEDNECYRCGKPGHLARRCTEDPYNNGEGQARPYRRDMGAKECYICRSTDHIQANCPEAVCYHCHKEGHIARDCPNGDECYNCGEVGHMARDCHQHRGGEASNDEAEADNENDGYGDLEQQRDS